MSTALPSFARSKVLVVGDVMLDRYWFGPTNRISPEAPVPVVRIQRDENRPGGAANVALNIAGLGGEARLVGVVGRDEAARVLKAELAHKGITARLIEAPEVPTITKLRVLSRNQQLIRLDFEESLSVSAHFNVELLTQEVREALGGAQVVVLSDYAKGTLRDAPAIIQAANEAGIPVLVDPKGNDYTRYRGATLIKPNYSEFEAVVGPCANEGELVEKGEQLCRTLSLQALLVTRSEHGMILIQPGRAPLVLPTEAREVYDVTGAGDTVIATLATAIAAGEDLPHACRLANLAAGVVVGKLGTATVSTAELQRAIRRQHEDDSGVLSEEQLLERVADARAEGQTIVMTNGCFDILHVGHVRYLEAARKLGDVLIVAVNEDASVQRLKGPSRPLNACQDRMKVLSSLRCVDWVVPFGEDTPERLISAVLPDILVKGGDYQPEQIAGYDAVTAAGGKVLVLDYHNGYSTTGLIERAQQP